MPLSLRCDHQFQIPGCGTVSVTFTLGLPDAQNQRAWGISSSSQPGMDAEGTVSSSSSNPVSSAVFQCADKSYRIDVRPTPPKTWGDVHHCSDLEATVVAV